MPSSTQRALSASRRTIRDSPSVSEELRVIERYTRPDLGHMEVEITIEDPGAFTAPHTFVRTFTLLTDWEIHEYVGNEFNVDVNHLVGQ